MRYVVWCYDATQLVSTAGWGYRKLPRRQHGREG